MSPFHLVTGCAPSASASTRPWTWSTPLTPPRTGSAATATAGTTSTAPSWRKLTTHFHVRLSSWSACPRNEAVLLQISSQQCQVTVPWPYTSFRWDDDSMTIFYQGPILRQDSSQLCSSLFLLTVLCGPTPKLLTLKETLAYVLAKSRHWFSSFSFDDGFRSISERSITTFFLLSFDAKLLFLPILLKSPWCSLAKPVVAWQSLL